MHRRGIADRRLVEGCPQLGLNIGDKLVVRLIMYHRFSASVIGYVNIILNRIVSVRDRELAAKENADN